MISTNHDCSLQTHRVFTQDRLDFALRVVCSALPFILQSKQSDECSSKRILESSPSRNLCKCKHRCSHLLFRCCLCILFTFVVLVVLFVYFFFLVFAVILRNAIICKYVCLLHCFVFVDFPYNFNVKRCKSKTPILYRYSLHRQLFDKTQIYSIQMRQSSIKVRWIVIRPRIPK